MKQDNASDLAQLRQENEKLKEFAHQAQRLRRLYDASSARLKEIEQISETVLMLSNLASQVSLDELMTRILDEVEVLTGSSIGFFHFVEDDQVTLQLQTWSTNTLQNMCTAEGKHKHYPIDQAGVWVDCVATSKPVIHNDYAGLSHKKGMPEGHAKVVRELVVPVIRGEKVKAIFGVGNKPTEYDDNDVKIASRVVDLLWDAVLANQTRTQMENNERRLQAAQQVAHLGSWELDLVNNVLWWSGENYRIFGAKPGTGNTYEAFLETVHPDDRAYVDREYTGSVKNRTPYNIEHRLLMPDGTVKWVNERCETYYDDDDKPLRSVGTTLDITEYKLAEQALLDEKTFSGTLIQSLPDIFFLLDRQGGLLRWNDRLAELFGLSEEEMSGANALEFVTEEDRPHVAGKLQQAFESGSASTEARLNLTNGLRHVLLIGTRIETRLGESVIGIGMDITERKQAEEELKLHAQESEKARKAMLFMMEDLNASSEEILRGKRDLIATFDAVSDPIFLHDSEYRVIRANLAYAEAAGMDIRDVIGKPYWQMFPKMDAPLPGCVKAVAAGRDATTSMEEEIRSADGRIHLSHSYIVQSGEQYDLFAVHVVRDITESRRHADRLKDALEGTISVVSKAVEARDPYISGHQTRVADLACAIAREMGLDEERIAGIHMGARIHDIGKIHLPAEILSKPGKLSEVEFNLVRSHPQVGYDILSEISFPWPVAEIAYQHHERLDGSGYPQGLEGEAICLEARIVAVADTVEAMASHRPYRPGLGLEAALQEVESNRGSLFDAEAVDACLKLFRSKGYTFAF